MQGVVEIERLLARDPEDAAHALVLEALDEDVGRAARGHVVAVRCGLL
jgi:hypothetical protein